MEYSNEVSEDCLDQLDQDEPAVGRELRFFLNSEKEIKKTIADFKAREQTPQLFAAKRWLFQNVNEGVKYHTIHDKGVFGQIKITKHEPESKKGNGKLDMSTDALAWLIQTSEVMQAWHPLAPGLFFMPATFRDYDGSLWVDHDNVTGPSLLTMSGEDQIRFVRYHRALRQHLNRTPLVETEWGAKFGWIDMQQHGEFGLRYLVRFEVPNSYDESSDDTTVVQAFCRVPERFVGEMLQYCNNTGNYYPFGYLHSV